MEKLTEKCEGCGDYTNNLFFVIERRGIFAAISSDGKTMPRSAYLSEIQGLHREGWRFMKVCSKCVRRMFNGGR